MHRIQAIAGLIAGLILLACGAIHLTMGWAQLHEQIGYTTASPGLISGIQNWWYFAGIEMLAFGCIAIAVFARALRGTVVDLLTVRIIGAMFLAFGIGALARIELDPFFVVVFIVPGVLLLFAALRWKARDAA